MEGLTYKERCFLKFLKDGRHHRFSDIQDHCELGLAEAYEIVEKLSGLDLIGYRSDRYEWFYITEAGLQALR